jgi:transcription termination/antitermination protein NusA
MNCAVVRRTALLTQAIATEEANTPQDDLLTMDGMDNSTAHLLASRGIRSMEELAEYAADELIELTGIEAARAAELIMTARAPWFEQE